MTLCTIDGLAAILPPVGRLIGLDPGKKFIGVALSDLSRTVASPAETLKRGKFADLAVHLDELIKAEEVAGIGVGLPLNMDGSEGPSAQSARQLAKNLSEKLDIAVSLWDERLSTAAVERAMIDADLTRRGRRKRVDKLAAAYTLQGTLDYITRINN